MIDAAFQEIGDRLTRALVGGDFALYRSIMALPLRIAPRLSGEYVLEDEAALRADFELYHQIIGLHGVTDIYREVLGDAALPDGRHQVTCRTHILVRANRLVEPFETRLYLRHDSDGWRITEIESSEGHINWTLGRAVILPGGQFETTKGKPDDAED